MNKIKQIIIHDMFYISNYILLMSSDRMFKTHKNLPVSVVMATGLVLRSV